MEERLKDLERRQNQDDIRFEKIKGLLEGSKKEMSLVRADTIEIRAQTTLTNGSVKDLQKFKAAVQWTVLGIIGMAVAQAIGVTGLVLEALR